ncbi:MAG TPA: hypothetical protein VK615_11910, partial [Candidatus Binatia bacterium]|nr:hypothetical protein [Candidatus Binatia bacterium]
SAASFNGYAIGVCFDELINTTDGGNPARYQINGVTPSSATLRADGSSVSLIVGGAPVSSPFTVTINNIHDLAGNNRASASINGTIWASARDIVGAAGSGASTLPAPGGTNYTCNVGDADVVAGGADVWNDSDEFHFIYNQVAGDFDVKVKVQRLDPSNRWAKGGLMARVTLDGNSPTIQAYTTPPSATTAEYETGLRSTFGGGTGGWEPSRPSLPRPNTWVRLRRVGSTFVSYYGSDGANWTLLSGPLSIPAAPPALFVGLMTTSHNTSQSTTAEYRSYSSFSYPGCAVSITQNPQNVSGSLHQLEVTFSGNATVSGAPAGDLLLIWQRSNDGGATWQDVPGQNAPTLRIAFPGASDNGARFRLKASAAGCSAISSVATLTLVDNPNLVYQKDSVMREFFLDPPPGGLNFPVDNPTYRALTNQWELNSADLYENYTTRMYAWFCPTETGDYRFYLASDDAGNLYISTDDTPANKVLVASEPQWGGRHEWTGDSGARRGGCGVDGNPAYCQNVTTLIPMVAGQRYYMETLHREGGGGDHLEVAVRLPSDATDPGPSIQGQYLGLFVPPCNIAFNSQPQNRTVVGGTPATFSVSATLTGSIIGAASYQWQRSDDGGATFTDIAGATGSSYTIAYANPGAAAAGGDNGTKLRVVVSSLGCSANSAVATLTVSPDTIRPTVTFVLGPVFGTNVAVYFSEPMGDSSPDTFSFELKDSSGTVLTISTASVETDGLTYTNRNRINLEVNPATPLVVGQTYTLTIGIDQGGFVAVVDMAGNVVDPAPTVRTFTAQNISSNPDNARILPQTGVLPLGSLTQRGFDLRFVQVTGAGGINSTLRAEGLLAGTVFPGSVPLQNNLTVQCAVETGIINYNNNGGNVGRITPDVPFPGMSAAMDDIAMEAVAYLELRAGFYHFGVNSDDGFRVSPALFAGDAGNATT